jgi:thymidylate kinase
MQQIIVLDGHDGVGKTALAQALADRVGGVYVKPFNGSLGDMIAWLWGREDYDFADHLARLAVVKASESQPSGRLLIFDRHWLSLFTVLPESLFQHWYPLPPTILCWTDLHTTRRRLSDRGETEGDHDRHEHYIARYRELADRFAVPVVDTTKTTVGEALRAVVESLGAYPDLSDYLKGDNDDAGMRT